MYLMFEIKKDYELVDVGEDIIISRRGKVEKKNIILDNHIKQRYVYW